MFVDHTPGLRNEPDFCFSFDKNTAFVVVDAVYVVTLSGTQVTKKTKFLHYEANPDRNIFSLPRFACVDRHFERLASKTASSL